jgi:zinc/manganese transport system permease protein
LLEILWLPFLACLVLAGIHAYLGLHVLARGVIFADLALAQVAALGTTAALLAGHAIQSTAAYQYSLAFTIAGAAVFAMTARRGGGTHGIPHEAIIGIVYAVAAAGTVLVLDRVPQGTEQIKQLLVGSILTVGSEEVVRAAGLYAGIGLVHWLCRRPLLALSLGPTEGTQERGGSASRLIDLDGGERRRSSLTLVDAPSTLGSPAAAPRQATPPHHIDHSAAPDTPPRLRRAWDFIFYVTFGIVVVSSVRIAGVLLVFSYLIVPAVIGALLAPTMGRRLAIAWTVGGVVSVAGLAASYGWDLPTGAAVVATFGAALLLVAFARGIHALYMRVARDGVRALTDLVGGAGIVGGLAGALLMLFPTADHLWLDAVESMVPPLQTAFLSAAERETLTESHVAAARGAAELKRLQALQADVQWGTRTMTADEQERLRQFLAGRGELVAGDRLVARTLRLRARNRQRFVLGPALAVGGLALALVVWRRR